MIDFISESKRLLQIVRQGMDNIILNTLEAWPVPMEFTLPVIYDVYRD